MSERIAMFTDSVNRILGVQIAEAATERHPPVG
jgi:hypothetical protein